jgi:broad specificity phosphatase PhoE
MAVLLRRPYWFLRHGETDWNRENRTQGSTDVPLNENGLAQARLAAALLHGRGIETIVCSPLERARRTADIVAAALGLAVQVRQDLREASFGAHEGEVMGEWFAAWVDGRVAPEGGESFAAVRARVVAALNEVLAGGLLTLIVGHGGVFRTVRAEMGFVAAVRTPNGVPLLCEPEADGWRMSPAEAAPEH